MINDEIVYSSFGDIQISVYDEFCDKKINTFSSFSVYTPIHRDFFVITKKFLFEPSNVLIFGI